MITAIVQTGIFEIRLYLKSKKFWLAAFLMNAYAWAAFLLAGQVMSGVAQMFIPVLLFLCAEVILRHNRIDFTKIIDTLPYNCVCLISGRALAVLAVFLLLGLELLMTILLAANTSLPVYYGWYACLAFMVKYGVACVHVLSITFFVSSLTKKAVPLYTALLCWWLIGVFLTGNIGVLFPQWVALVNFTFIHGFGGNPSEVSGVYPYEGMITTVIGFQLTWSVILFIIAVNIETARRRSKINVGKMCFLGVNYVVVIVLTFYAAWQQLGPLNTAQEKVAPSLSTARLEPASPNALSSIYLANYDLHITLDTKSHTMAAKSQVTMGKSDGTAVPCVEFTLRDCFSVQQVINKDTGKPLLWQQHGPYITVTIPPDSFTANGLLTVEISYLGIVSEWAKDIYGQPTGLVNIVASPFTFLRGGYGWYPVLGRQPLYTVMSYTLPLANQPKQLMQSVLVTHKPVPFKLLVDSDSEDMCISNMELSARYKNGGWQRHEFFSAAGKDVFLLVGPYEHVRLAVNGSDKAIDFYYFTAHNYNLHNMTYKVSQIDYYNKLVPREKHIVTGDINSNYAIFEVPRFLTYDSLMNTSNLGIIDAIALPEAIFITKALQSPWWSQPAGRILSEARSLNLWWPNCFSKTNGDIADGLALYMYTLYGENRYGKKFYDNAREYWQVYSETSPANEEMLGQRGRVVQQTFLLVDGIRQSRLGDEGVKQFLRLVNNRYQEKRVISVADLVDALEVIGASQYPDSSRNDANAIDAKVQNHIDSLNHLLTNPPENRAGGPVTLKLNWDFGAQIKASGIQ